MKSFMSARKLVCDLSVKEPREQFTVAYIGSVLAITASLLAITGLMQSQGGGGQKTGVQIALVHAVII